MEGSRAGEGSGQDWQQPSGQQGGSPPPQQQQGGSPPPQQHGGHQGQQAHGREPSGPLLSEHQKSNIVSMGPNIMAVLGAVLAIGAIVVYADNIADNIGFAGHLAWWTLWGSGVLAVALSALSDTENLLSKLTIVLLGFLLILGSMGGGLFGLPFGMF